MALTSFEKPKPKRKTGRLIGHENNGWPHYRSNTERCICVQSCCYDPVKGCVCKNCICITDPEAHYKCHVNTTRRMPREPVVKVTAKEAKADAPISTGSLPMADKTAPIKSPEQHSHTRETR